MDAYDKINPCDEYFDVKFKMSSGARHVVIKTNIMRKVCDKLKPNRLLQYVFLRNYLHRVLIEVYPIRLCDLKLMFYIRTSAKHNLMKGFAVPCKLTGGNVPSYRTKTARENLIGGDFTIK